MKKLFVQGDDDVDSDIETGKEIMIEKKVDQEGSEQRITS